MAIIPYEARREFILTLAPISRGKVRDTYELPKHPNLLLVVATDRISIFDFVLNAEVKDKGYILTAFNIFWRKFISENLSHVRHDLVAYGSQIDQYLPEGVLKDNTELQKRAIVVKKLDMYSYEAIVRGYLTGSGLKSYKKDGRICGHEIEIGLKDGSKFASPLFTPTTKADEGHDENINYFKFIKEHGSDPETLSIQIYDICREYALSKNIIIADTKLEFGKLVGRFTLGDEVLTPDSSRFWDSEERITAMTSDCSPESFDKEIVRNFGKKIGINKRDPEVADDVKWVHEQTIPKEILSETTGKYHKILERLSGSSLENFHESVMLIK